jgi:hypothetical protein
VLAPVVFIASDHGYPARVQIHIFGNDAIVPLEGGEPLALVEGGEPLALVSWVNLLEQELTPSWLENVTRGARGACEARGGRLVLYSGWLGGGARPQDGIFPRHDEDHRTWMPQAHIALDQAWAHLREESAERGITVLLRPHARHVLSDPHSCLAFLRRQEGEPAKAGGLGLIPDPAALLTEAMLPRAEDHLRRAFETLGGHPRTAAVILSNVQPASGDLCPAPLHRGVVDPRAIAALARRHAAGVPWVILNDDVEAQLAMLRG